MSEPGSLFRVVEGHHIAQDHITTFRFDQHEEGAWIGTSGGWVTQVGLPGLHRVCSAPLHAGPVIDSRSWSSSFLSLSAREIIAHSSGGAIQQCLRAPQDDSFSCMELHREGAQVLTGCAGSGTVCAYDLGSARSAGKWNYEGEMVVALRGPLVGGTFLAASANGQISLLDGRARTQRPGSTLPAHKAGFEAVDAAGNLIATAGYALVRNQPSLERQVKVFDVRMIPRLLCMLPFGAGPSLLRFHPRLPSALVVASTSGSAMILDAGGAGAGTPLPLDIAHGLTALDVSPTGDLIAAATNVGWVQVLGAGEVPSVNMGGMMHIGPPPESNPPPLVPLGPNDPLSSAPQFLNVEGPRLVSALFKGERASVGPAPRKIDPDLLTHLKWSDSVGVAANPFYERRKKSVPGEATAKSVPLRSLRSKSTTMHASASSPASKRHASRGNTTRSPSRHQSPAGDRNPRLERYRKVLVHQATQQGGAPWYQEFDYTKYNSVPGVLGLENDLANAYANALVQTLFFIPSIRSALLKRMPDPKDEFGLADEIALLFRMLQTPGTMVCRAANLLRALRQSHKALALGLVEGVSGQLGARDTEVETAVERSLPRRIESLSRFLLETLHRSLDGESGGPVLDTFGMQLLTEMRCSVGKKAGNNNAASKTQTKQGLVFQLELGSEPRTGDQSLVELIQCSLSNSSTIRAWFDSEVKYTTVLQRRVVTSLPEVMLVACGASSSSTTGTDSKNLTEFPALSRALAVDVRVGDDAEHGIRVSQADTLQELIASSPSSSVLSSSPSTSSCAPMTIDAAESYCVLYELTAAISHIRDPDEASGPGGRPPEGHLVAEIRVPKELQSVGSGEVKVEDPLCKREDVDGQAAGLVQELKLSQCGDQQQQSEKVSSEDWVLFNDFRVESVPWTDVASSLDGYKRPCLLVYTKRRVLYPERETAALVPPKGSVVPKPIPSFQPTPVLNPDGFLRLCRLPSLGARAGAHPLTFIPPSAQELPKPGMLVGLDAEFVSYSPPQYSTIGGLQCITLPSRLGLARVSVVRGWSGPLGAQAFIDDYICGRESVYDYLTRWSGIMPGDLMPQQSPHYLTTMKRAYLKLRYLVDCGVTFVGHGLKQDFRMINILVPPDQIVDTVRIFHKPRQRQLSLRFLSSWVLRTVIQEGNHDSIEDASAALGLYKVYLELKQQGKFEELLDKIYSWGKIHGWEPVIWKDEVPHPAQASTGNS